jgi:hypothetical protein
MIGVALLGFCLALSGCADEPPAPPPQPSAPAAPVTLLPAQPARLFEPPAPGFGCIWPRAFEAGPVEAQNDLVGRCERLLSGRRYTVVIDGQASLPADAGPGAQIVLKVGAPGLEELVAAPLEASGGAFLSFRTNTRNHATVPTSQAVLARIDPLECLDGAGAPIACRLEQATVIIFSSR